MKNIITLLVLFVFIGKLKAQTYDLLNEVLPDPTNERTYLKSQFESLNNKKFIDFYLTETFIRENWELFPSKKTPDLSLFFDQVSLDHVRAMVSVAISHEDIDFGKLKSSIIKVHDLTEHLKYEDVCNVISKPIFSCDNQWAILYRYATFKQDVGNSGVLYIYRKIGNTWSLYHKITLWLS